MSDTTKIRVGVAMARELEIEVEDADAVVKDFEKALSDGNGVLWITDSKGHRHGLVVGQLAFLEIEKDASEQGVGF